MMNRLIWKFNIYEDEIMWSATYGDWIYRIVLDATDSEAFFDADAISKSREANKQIPLGRWSNLVRAKFDCEDHARQQEVTND